MIVDSSAILAILLREPEADLFKRKLADAETVRMSVAAWLESTIAIESKGGVSAGVELDALLGTVEIDLVDLTRDQVEVARQAWRRFGKGNHPARLNFGDCFSYALSKTSGEPLLFKGNDFSQTDIVSA